MKKLLVLLFVLLFIPAHAFGADTKISALNAKATPIDADQMALVDTVAGETKVATFLEMWTNYYLVKHDAVGSNPHSVTKSDVALGNVTNDAQLTRGANDWATLSGGYEASPNAGDRLVIESSTGTVWDKHYILISDLPTGSGVPDGVDTQMQYNNAGAFGATVGLTWNDGATKIMGILDDIYVHWGTGTDFKWHLDSVTSDLEITDSADVDIFEFRADGTLWLKAGIDVKANATAGQAMTLKEKTGSGTNWVKHKAADTMGADLTITWGWGASAVPTAANAFPLFDTGPSQTGWAYLGQIPSAADPTTTEGYIAWDSDDEALEVHDGTRSILVPSRQSFTVTISEPDLVQTVTDPLTIKHFPSAVFPGGVTLESIIVSTDTACTDVIDVREYSNNGTAWTNVSSIDSVTLSGTETTETTITDAVIAAGNYIRLDLDDTTPCDVKSMSWTFVYRVEDFAS